LDTADIYTLKKTSWLHGWPGIGQQNHAEF